MAGLLLAACGGTKTGSNAGSAEELAAAPGVPTFVADSAYEFCKQQCDFGPRTMNSAAHDRCGQWIADKFGQFGMEVELQRATLRGYDGTPLQSTNITARYKPELRQRVLLCAHWDSRPWADNDPDASNHRTPVMAANDGASGVAVMLEVARLIAADTLAVGVDFVCFDAEDWGTPQWETNSGNNDGDTWALGAQYWAEQWRTARQAADSSTDGSAVSMRYGILLDMVGGEGARFYQEQVSLMFAPSVVSRVWAAAHAAGYGSFFVKEEGGGITDDHVPVNRVAGIPCIDIIAYYPDCEASSFGPTWHTVNDTMEHIDRSTLEAVGQTLLHVLYAER